MNALLLAALLSMNASATLDQEVDGARVWREAEQAGGDWFHETSIFGGDERISVDDAPEPWRSMARGTPAMFPNYAVSTVNGVATLATSPYGTAQRLQRGTRFYGQPAGAGCSAALIGPDMVLTAGHCVNAGNCASKSFVFDFFATSAPVRVPAASVYRCAQVVDGDFDTLVGSVRSDWVVLRLDRVVTGRPIMPVVNRAPARGDPIAMIGYPAGLTGKVTFGTMRGRWPDGYLHANLDEFHGNSGSPVFDARGRIIGVLVRGPEDFEDVPRQRNAGPNAPPPERRERRYLNNWGYGAGIMPVDRVFERIRAALRAPRPAPPAAAPASPPAAPPPGGALGPRGIPHVDP